MLFKNRKFYDLCRKYKYHYKAYQKIKPLKDVYWSKYLQEAYNEVEHNLEETETEMILLLLDEMIDDSSEIEISRDFMKSFASERRYPTDRYVTVYDGCFANKLEEYLDNKRGMPIFHYY